MDKMKCNSRQNLQKKIAEFKSEHSNEEVIKSEVNQQQKELRIDPLPPVGTTTNTIANANSDESESDDESSDDSD